MSDPTKAVFLSYASQDAGSARLICEALRAAGLEVWFDQAGGLEHGDEWDAKIRQRIRECVLFIPVISANTQARLEGYFRVEWELAAERALGFAANVPFILPIVIDGTREGDALVPDRFRRVQWTRLPGGSVTDEVRARFVRLWTERTTGRPAAVSQSEPRMSHLLSAEPPLAREKSIAVLPFANMSADPENEYFSDGMTEEIINALVQVPGLFVAARTSVFVFKGKVDDLRAIGTKLNVRTVLEGSVRKAGNRIRITAQLINAADGFNLWSERWDRELDDIFAVQDEIARTIVDRLKVKLTGDQVRQLVTPPTQDLEAYQLYLQGRYFWGQRGAGLAKGLQCFEAALARDPKYALAHTGVADAYTLLSFYGHARARDVMPRARTAAEQALALDPELAEAHCALGFILLNYEHDTRAALREFGRAIELKPTYVPAYYWRAATYCVLERYAEAVESCEAGVRLEPFSLIATALLGWTLITHGRSQEAVTRLKPSVEMEPRFAIGHWILGMALVNAGKWEEGQAELRAAIEFSRNLPFMVGTLGTAAAFAGDRAVARATLAELQQRAKTEYVPAFVFAMLHASLGEEACAVDWLERSIEDYDAGLVYMRVDLPWVGPLGIPRCGLKSETRAAIAKRLGLYRE